ncbi:ABC transporter permease [Rhizobium straminoryzae]|uniref:ABC transporter permease n=1 Tax=Rhizobium straminoryzae TaxID=1387186 RepID=A0A549SV26_9HYPH|nr:ABC transporter permease [Rhizobium straminoryzae]TRL33479.1 ABC transporter permease [Rhizobium straminoryzae]
MVMRSSSNFGRAIEDIAGGLSRRELWLYLGWQDVRKHYRRSVIGPFWLTLSMGIMVLGIGILYSQIFRIDVQVYLPYMAVGIILWGLIGRLITDACTVFTQAGDALRQIKVPLSVYIFQFVWSQILTFAHNFVIYIIVAIVFAVPLGWDALLVFPGLVLIVLNGIFATMILGPVCARFRDVPMMIGSLMQLLFYMTPIVWHGEQLSKGLWLLMLNPFYHFIEIVRRPLMGQPSVLENWLVCGVITVVMGAVAVLFFARYRARIVYWS